MAVHHQELTRTTDFSRSQLFKPSRTFRPVFYPWAVEMWGQHEDMHWTKREIELGPDTEDWNSGRLIPRHRGFITHVFRMFTQSDVNVGVGYIKYLLRQYCNNEIVMMATGCANREGTHQNNYANVIDTLNLPESEYTAFLDYKEMLAKHEFMLDLNVDTVEEFMLTLVKMIFNEGVTLFGSFVMLLSFKKRGLMQGMGTVVEWSCVDEDLHVEFHSCAWHELVGDYPELLTDALKARIYDLAKTCVKLETAFIDMAFEVAGELPNLTRDETVHYITYLANRRLMRLGMKPIFTEVDPNDNPLPWVAEMIQGASHTNFFEKTVTDYSASGLDGDIVYEVPLPSDLSIFTRDGCGYCVEAKALATEYGIPYIEVDMSDFDERQAFFDSRGFDGGDRTMPKIYDQAGRFLGGATELKSRIQLSPEFRERAVPQDDEISNNVVFTL